MNKMKLYEYDGRKVITLENIEEYIINDKSKELVKNRIYMWLKGKGTLLDVKTAKKYGQKKKFNYARGLWVFNLDDAKNIICSREDYYKGRFDVKAFKNDIEKGVIRCLGSNKEEKVIVEESPKQMQMMPFDEVYALMDRMAEIYQKSNNELKAKVEELINKVNELTENKEIPQPAENNETVLILKQDATYDEWQKIINRALDLIMKEKPEWTKSDILHVAYNRLKTQYGVVWEQESKEFKEEYGRGPINTRELCWWMETTKPTYKNLLIGKLNTIYSEAKRGIA